MSQRLGVLPDHWRAVARNLPLPASDAVKVAIAYHLAAKLVHEGSGHDEQMYQLAYALNMATALAELGVCAESRTEIHKAQQALMVSHATSHKIGRWAIRDDEYKVICAALLVHDRQIETATQAQIQAADRAVIRCARDGLVLTAD